MATPRSSGRTRAPPLSLAEEQAQAVIFQKILSPAARKPTTAAGSSAASQPKPQVRKSASSPRSSSKASGKGAIAAPFVPTFIVGERVEMWYASERSWFLGTVLRVSENRGVSVYFDDGEETTASWKELEREGENLLRPAAPVKVAPQSPSPSKKQQMTSETSRAAAASSPKAAKISTTKKVAAAVPDAARFAKKPPSSYRWRAILAAALAVAVLSYLFGSNIAPRFPEAVDAETLTFREFLKMPKVAP